MGISSGRFGLTIGACFMAGSLGWAQAPGAGTASPAAADTSVRDPFEHIYRDYSVDFSEGLKAMQQAGRSPEEMKLSSEKNYFTLTLLDESSRSEALVAAGKEKEKAGMFREALEIYQKIIDEYPDKLYRVSEWGIFVPIAEYCQLRILGFPKEHLDFYRTKHDSRARESFEVARQRNSLEGIAQVRDQLLATSFGGPALMTLGYSALDKGHFLEALEYFEMVWTYFPDLRAQNPGLPLSIELCRKMLGMGGKTGSYGLIGHWKLDEGSGATVADASGLNNNGTIGAVPVWTQGKIGGALGFTYTNAVRVPARTFLDVGMGGADFSVAFWAYWESGQYPNTLFTKRGNTADDMLSLGAAGKDNQIAYSIATQSPKWETGNSRGGLAAKQWTHVAFVKAGNEVRLYINGKLDTRDTLKAPALKNMGGVGFGQGVMGRLDDVRLYNRDLLDREVAELAGAAGTATLTASSTAGEAPLTVDFSCPATGAGLQYLWEFGDGQTATGAKVRHVYGVGGEPTAVLTVTDTASAINVARQKITVKWPPRDEGFARRMNQVLGEAKFEKQVNAVQLTSPPNIATDDFVPMPPPTDPLGLQPPVWKQVMPGSRRDYHVYAQPVVTRNSVVFRHKNIVYCHSLLNGELRWKNDLGGRVTWQDDSQFQWPQDDVLVQDGLVFGPMLKVGQTLVALDEITGRMKWAHGPMAAGTVEESNMRFGAAPAGGPQTVYAGYVLDNIEGDTHTDTEYGLMAFESTTGRIKWRRPICTLRPGQFSAGFAVRFRNKIRSFFSPPLYHQGTVYYDTNAGAIAALDALSGRIKWVMRYPYYSRAHDATLSLYANYFHPTLWHNQRPLLIGDQLYVLPVDSSLFISLDRRTGKVLWNRTKMSAGHHYFAGAISSGELAMATYGRCRTGYDLHQATPPVVLLDPRTGKTVWEAPDIIIWENQPVLKHWRYGTLADIRLNIRPFDNAARPFLGEDDVLFLPTWSGEIGPYWRPGCHVYHLTGIDLRNRRIVSQRRYLSETLLAQNQWQMDEAPKRIKQIEDVPHKDDGLKEELQLMKDIAADKVPINQYGPFLPFSRVTFERYGVPFELRLNARSLEMVYERDKVKQSVAGRSDPEGLFARAELAMGENRLREAADLMIRCLNTMSSEDLDFRATVNQLLYKVHKELARAGIRGGDTGAEQTQVVGMSRTVTTLADEMETLFAVAQAAQRRREYMNAARQLQSIANIYGQYEYPVPEILAMDAGQLAGALNGMLDASRERVGNPMFGSGLQKGVDLLKGTFPVYRSAVSPLPKTLTVRAGELAANGLIEMQKAAPEFAKEFEALAAREIGAKPAAEQLARLWEFPGTPTAQAVLDRLSGETEKGLQAGAASLADQAGLRRRLWLLADSARICGLKMPAGLRARVGTPPPAPSAVAPGLPMVNRTQDLEESRGTAWLVLERRGDRTVEPDLMFLGGRVKKKFDNKFTLYCTEMSTGKVRWKAQEKRGETWFDEIRLQGKGDEPGFFETFVHGDVVVVHGMFDVLAFGLGDGRLIWRYEVPFAFDIRQAVKSGDLLILAGQAETVALYLPTKDPRGEVVWQEKEEGDLYMAPSFQGDRLVNLRKAPSNLTVRYRSTGRLIGRLALPDLLLEDSHPLVENGPRALPAARDGNRLAVTDGWYYIMLDVERMTVLWKRLIDSNDTTKLPPMRMVMGGDYLAVLKQDYDVKTIYMLSSQTGEVMWNTDPKNPNSPQPLYTMTIRDGRLFGLRPHPGQAFYFAGMDCKTGANLFNPNEQKGYGGKPEARLLPVFHGDTAVALIKDRQDYEVKLFDVKDGKLLHAVKVKSTGEFGEHGRASATAQDGRLVLLGKNELIVAGRGK